MITTLDPLSAGLTMNEWVLHSSFSAFSSSLVRFFGSGSFFVLFSAPLSCSISSSTTGSVSAGVGSQVEGIRNGVGFPFWVLFLKKVDHLILRWYCCTCNLHDSCTFLILVSVGRKKSPLFNKFMCCSNELDADRLITALSSGLEVGGVNSYEGISLNIPSRGSTYVGTLRGTSVCGRLLFGTYCVGVGVLSFLWVQFLSRSC